MIVKHVKRIILITILLLQMQCLQKLDLKLSENQLRIFQLFLLLYPDLVIENPEREIVEGNTISLKVKLKNEPYSPVIIPIYLESPLLRLNTNRLYFDTENWDYFQEIQIHAPDDLYYEKSEEKAFFLGPAESGDFFYSGKSFSTTFFYKNLDELGINYYYYSQQIIEGSGFYENAYIYFTLKSKPKDAVTLLIENPSPLDMNFSTNNITIQPNDWNLNWTFYVVVSAINDTLREYTENFTIKVRSVSNDPNYNGLVLDLPITIIDDEEPGIDTIYTFDLYEGDSISRNIRLLGPPTDNVNLTITATPSSMCNITSGSSLTFTTTNYNTYQNFTIQARPSDDIDNIDENNYNCTITITSTSNDAGYNGLRKEIKGKVRDSRNAGFVIDGIYGYRNLGTLAESNTSSKTFQLKLNSQPTSTVKVCIKTSDLCRVYIDSAGINPPDGSCNSIAGANTPYLIYDSTNWNIDKTITVKGRHDYDYRAGALTIPETGNHCSPPFPKLNNIVYIDVYTSCPGCNTGERPYYNSSPFYAYNHYVYLDILEKDKFTFLTAPHNGDFLSDFNLGGSNAIEKADYYCDLQRPNDFSFYSIFKAFLVGGTRGANPLNDWVLQPNKYYFRYEDNKLLFKTDANSRFIFNDPEVYGILDDVWTGLNADWTTSTNNCSNWSSTTSSGVIGQKNTNTSNAINNNTISCSNLKKVLCIQQF